MNANLLRFADWNPWWRDGAVPPAWRGNVERRDAQWLLDRMRAGSGTVILLKGPRRVGKTTLMHQVAAGLLAGGCKPEELLYVPLDDPGLTSSSLFDDLQKAHPGRTRFYFLDEVTHRPDWAHWVKRLIDLKTGANLLLGSSSSALLRKGAGESLAGRVLEREVFPFSASERGELLGLGPRLAPELASALAAAWERFLADPDPAALFEGLRSLADRIPFPGGPRDLAGFLAEGGFPEYLIEKDPAVRTAWFQSAVVDRVLFVDLPQVFTDIGDRAALRDLLRLVAGRGASLFVAEHAASDLGLARQTVSKYLAYLPATGLVRVLEKWSPSAASRARAPRKVLAADPGLYASIAGIGESEARRGGEATGTMAEIAVCAEFLRKGAGELFHWRERDREVDFVLACGRARSGKKPLVSVEVKAGAGRATGRLPGLDAFRGRFPDRVRAELVLNPDLLERRGARVLVPFELFFS